MAKPQLAVRVPVSLLEKLDSYTVRTGMTKTDVVVNALAQYLGCASDVPLSHRVAELEAKMVSIETRLSAE